MKPIFARLIEYDCSECRDELLSEVRAVGLPLPTTHRFLVPSSWADRKCAHGRRGLVLHWSPVPDDEPHTETSSRRANDGEGEIRIQERWDNLDATKGFGYYARENGRIGSHPSHDRFDSDSEP